MRPCVHVCSVAKLCLTLFDPESHKAWTPARLLCPWDSLGKNTSMSCHFLLQGIFPTQGLTHATWWLRGRNVCLRCGRRGFGTSPGEGNGSPLQYSCLENPMDRGAWWAAVHGVSKSQTRLSDFTSFHFHFPALYTGSFLLSPPGSAPHPHVAGTPL